MNTYDYSHSSCDRLLAEIRLERLMDRWGKEGDFAVWADRMIYEMYPDRPRSRDKFGYGISQL